MALQIFGGGGGASAGSLTGTFAAKSSTWRASTAYKAGELVTQGGIVYAANADFTSGASFTASNWTAVGGGVTSVAGRTGAIALSTADVSGSFTPGPLDLLPVVETGLPVPVAQYDADSITPQTDATAVASWPDDTGTTGALTQPTGANQPLLKLNQVNGHSAVRLAGGSWWMSKALSLTSNFTIVAVGKPTNAFQNVGFIGNMLSSYSGRICGPGEVASSSPSVAYPGWAVYRITVTGGTYVLYRNGAPIRTGTAPNLTSLIVGHDGSGTFFSDWDVAHIRAYSGVIVPEEGTSIDYALARRYGLRAGSGAPSIRTRINSTVNGQAVSLSLPETRVPGQPIPLVIFSHGGGGTQDAPYGYNGQPGTTSDALLAAGFAVASSNLHGDSAGNAQQLQDNLDLLTWVQTQITVSKLLLVGQSLGGLPTLNAIRKNTYGPTGIPVLGALLIYPVTDPIEFYGFSATGVGPVLATAYNLVNGTFSAAASSGTNTISLSVSYAPGTKLHLEPGISQRETVTVASVSGSGPYAHVLTTNTTKAHASGAQVSDAGTKIEAAGFNPADGTAANYGNKRYRFYHSTSDTTVPMSTNTTPFIAKITATAREASLVPTRGIHGDQSNFDGRDQAQFFLRCLNDPTIV